MKMHPTAGRVTETDPCAVAESHPAPALAVTVEIVDDDIEHGHIAKCRSCPAALAANRATGRFCDTGGFHLVAYDNPQYLENQNLLVGLLPEAAKLWIARFDAQRDAMVADPPGPMSFPHGTVPDRRLRAAAAARRRARHARETRPKPAWPSPSSGRSYPNPATLSSSPGATAISRGHWASSTAPPPLSTKSTGRSRPSRGRIRDTPPRRSEAPAGQVPDGRLNSNRGDAVRLACAASAPSPKGEHP